MTTNSCRLAHLALYQSRLRPELVGRVDPLGDDAFGAQRADMAQQRLAIGLEMRAVAKHAFRRSRREDLLQRGFALESGAPRRS